MPDEPTDDDLMRAYAGGDARAFERLYQRHAGPLYRFVRRLLGRQGSGRVDEVFQDSWTRVVQARERWSPQGAAFRTWLFTIAQRLRDRPAPTQRPRTAAGRRSLAVRS